STIKALKWCVRNRAHDAAPQARPQWVILYVNDGEFDVRERVGKTRHGYLLRRNGRPRVPTGQAAGENPHVISIAGGGGRHRNEMVERGRRPEWRDDPVTRLRNKADRSNMSTTITAGRDHDGLAN